jgi:4-amino-4-deoxy-L-arabinose transferase-like glycosyltransferase
MPATSRYDADGNGTAGRRSPRAWHLALLLVLALGICVGAWHDFDPEVVPPYSDTWDYLQLGRQIATGQGFTSLFSYPLFLPWSGDSSPADGHFPLLWRPPIYPMLVAGSFALTGGPSAWAPVLLQALGYLLAILATYLLVLEFTGRRWALLGGLVVALSPPLIGLEEPGIATTLYGALLVFAVRAVLRADTRGKAALAGATFGLLALLRGEAVLFLPAMMWLLWAGDRGDRERRIWLFLVAAVLVSVPWILRTWIVSGRPFFGTSSLLFIETTDFPAWTSSRSVDTLSRSALLWALSEPVQVGWKSLKNLYHYLTQALLLPLPALAPFVWAAAGRLTRVGRESAWCSAILIALGLTILVLSPLEYAPRLLVPFIPLLTVVGIILLDRIREKVGDGDQVRYTRRPALWVAAAVVTLAALQTLGALKEARARRVEWRRDYGPLAHANWGEIAASLPAAGCQADYPAYYGWKTGIGGFVWIGIGRRDDPRLPVAGLLYSGRGASGPDPTGVPPTAIIEQEARGPSRGIDALVLFEDVRGR